MNMNSLKKYNDSVVYSFSTREDGNMSFNHGDTSNSLNNRKEFLGKIGIDYKNLVCPKQVHEDKIYYVRKEDIGKGALADKSAIPGVDALVTDGKNIPIAVFSADCLVVFLYDPKTPAIALIHAGWRGTKDKISRKTVQFMKDKFKINEENLCAYFSPSVRGCSYEVGSNFQEIFPENVVKKDGRFYLDLAEANKKELLESGLWEYNITDSGVCTFCQKDKFFSYRAEAQNCGRMMTVAMLR